MLKKSWLVKLATNPRLSVNDIWNKSYMKCGNEMKMKKWSSQWTQFMQLRKEAWKKSRTSTGFEPVTWRYRCDVLPTELWSHWRWEQVLEFNLEFQIVGPWWRILNCLINSNDYERTQHYLKRKAGYSYSLFGQMAHFILLILACIKMWSAKQIIKGSVIQTPKSYLNRSL